MKTGSLAFLWRPFDKQFGKQKQILAITTPKDYSYPDGFKVDERYDDDQPMIVNKDLQNYNINSLSTKLINHAIDLTHKYKSKQNVPILWGDDFSFMNAPASFKALETIIESCNKLNG
jgi:hypothetical protein